VTDPGVTAGGRPAIVVDLARAGFTDAVEVGRGGFGVVFRCTQEALNRTVAVKLLHTDLDTVSRERFFREGRAMGGLSGHPNVVDVLQVGVTHSGRPYIVMPFQSLDSLAVRVRREGPIPWEEATRMGVRLAGALECAHRVGTLHRDIKPANILLSDYGEAQLTDFGIARIEGGFETATGAFTGSLSYSSPEVLNGRPPTRQSDIYGLAAALFSIIAGRAAFERREGEEIIAQFLRITGQPIPDLRGHGVPDELCAVLERAMAKDPADRPASAEAFGRELQGVQRDAGLPVAEMALPVGRRPADKNATDATEVAQFEDRSPRRTSNPLPLVERPWAGTLGAGAAGAMPHTSVEPVLEPRGCHGEPGTGHRATARVADGGHGGALGQQGGRRGHGRRRQAGLHGLALARAALRRHRPRALRPPGRIGADGRPPRPPARRPGRVRPTGSTPPPLPAPQPPSPDRRSRRLPLVAIGVVVALLASLAVVGVLVFGRSGTTPTTAGPPPVTPVVPASAWRTLRPDPTPRQQVATTVADGTVWVIGGITQGAASNLMEGYDPAIDTWKTGIPLPVGLSHEMAVTYRGEIIVLGGWEAQGGNLTAVSSKKVYAQRGGGWVELPPMLSSHVAGGAVVVGDQIIVSGGQADGKLNPTTEVFDGTAWKRVTDLPTPREHLGMATDGTYAYVVGGRDLSSDKNSSALERYDPKTDSWAALAAMPAPRGGAGAAVADGRLVVAGGEEPTAVDNSVYAYDITSNTCRTCLRCPPAGTGPRSAPSTRRSTRSAAPHSQPHRIHRGGRGAADPAAEAAARAGVAAAEGRARRAPVRGHRGGGREDVGAGRAHAGRRHARRLRLRPGHRHVDARPGPAAAAAPPRGGELPRRARRHRRLGARQRQPVGLVSGKVFALRGGAWVELRR
jgi:non-specific serine/threonine protein kinase